jgi:hypothetical protein
VTPTGAADTGVTWMARRLAPNGPGEPRGRLVAPTPGGAPTTLERREGPSGRGWLAVGLRSGQRGAWIAITALATLAEKIVARLVVDRLAADSRPGAWHR